MEGILSRNKIVNLHAYLWISLFENKPPNPLDPPKKFVNLHFLLLCIPPYMFLQITPIIRDFTTKLRRGLTYLIFHFKQNSDEVFWRRKKSRLLARKVK